MKVIIAGGQEYNPSDYEEKLVKLILDDLGATEVVSGGARGVDKWGECLGEQLGLAVSVFKAEWNKYGNPAGPIRNMQMAKYSDACILLTGNRGTKDMYSCAKKLNLKIADLRDGKYDLSWRGLFNV